MTFRNKIIWQSAVAGALLIALVLGAIFAFRTRAVAIVKQPVFPGLRVDQVASIEIAAPSAPVSSASPTTPTTPAPSISSSRTPSGAPTISPAPSSKSSSASKSSPSSSASNTSPSSSANTQPQLTLTRGSSGDWSVTDATAGSARYPADPGQVSSFLSDLTSLQTTRRVTHDPSLYSDFGVESSSARRITLTSADGTKRVIYAGKDDISGEYVRIGTDPEVYLADKSIRFYATRDTSSWYDLRLLPHALQFSDVQTIDYQFSSNMDADQKSLLALPNPPPVAAASLPPKYEQSGYRLVRRQTSTGQDNWFLESDLALSLNQQEVEAVARAAVQLDASSFVTDGATSDSAVGLSKPALVATLIFADGSRYSIDVGSLAAKNEFYTSADGPNVSRSPDGSPFRYEVSRWSLEQVFEPVAKLVAPSPPRN